MAADTYVAFVRAVMIGREGLQRTVLLDIFERAGAESAVSYISTGNVSFRSRASRVDALIDEVSGGISAVVERPTEIFVRPLNHLVAMVESEPYADQPLTVDHGREVTFFLDTVPADVQLPITDKHGNVVVFAASERELFSVSVKEGRISRGAGGLIEAATGERVTTRAWSTIERILEKLA